MNFYPGAILVFFFTPEVSTGAVTSSVRFFPPAECPASAVADVAFLLAGSWASDRAAFKNVRGLTAAVAGAFQIGPDKTRVAVLQYGGPAPAGFSLDRHLSRPGLMRAIGALDVHRGNARTGAPTSFINTHIYPGGSAVQI